MHNEDKEIIKQAIKEWLTEQKAAFGWWVIKWLGVAFITYILTWWITTQGGKLPHV